MQNSIAVLIQIFPFQKKYFLLAYISFTGRFRCDIYLHAYNMS
jgi:hypothetical protein